MRGVAALGSLLLPMEGVDEVKFGFWAKPLVSVLDLPGGWFAGGTPPSRLTALLASSPLSSLWALALFREATLCLAFSNQLTKWGRRPEFVNTLFFTGVTGRAITGRFPNALASTA